ncbi:hypothetical protein LEN26_010522 [Aphanomyces euteiches]|nr:hypothetical protein AeMF1_009605 [Aphanomyces euteiches]KAH9121799.1 hypothetical protein LEN26_010522 [Aphanomyces euteiches]
MDEVLFDQTTSASDDTTIEYQRKVALKKLFVQRIWQRWRIHDISVAMTLEDQLKDMLNEPTPRRQDVVRTLQTKFLAIPDRDAFLYRGIIWQILLNVNDTQRQAALADDLEAISERLAAMPRDPLMAKEIDEVFVSLQYIAGDFVRSGMETVLLWLLKAKSVPYTSGMAHALAPFFLLQLPLHTIYDCYYRYCALYLPHLVSGVFSFHDDVPIEMEQRQKLTEQLLIYHDPPLAQFLMQWAPDWMQRIVPLDYFCCNLYRRLQPTSFLYLLDQYLITEDMDFGLFVVLAIVLLHREAILAETTSDGVRAVLKPLWALERPDRAAVTAMLATSLRRKTPTSYTHLWHVLPHPAFIRPSSADNLNKVDMAVWTKHESKTLTGRFYWYNEKTQVTQFEHPEASHEPPPPLLCLTTSVAEIASANLGATTHHLRYFIVDCRSTRSSQDIKSGSIPSAFPLDSTVFDNPELMDVTLDALKPLRSQVHLVLVGHGAALPTAGGSEEIAANIREGIRDDIAVLNRAALFFQKHGFRFVSCLDGGYAAWHAFMRDADFTSVSELIGHDQAECRHCRVDAGVDPDEVKKPRRKSLLKLPSLPPSFTRLSSQGSNNGSSKERLSLTSVLSNGSSPAPRESLKSRLSGWYLKRRNSVAESTTSTEGFEGEEDLTGEPMEPRGSLSDDEEIEIALPTLTA